MPAIRQAAFDKAVAALEWAARSVHHPACPIPRGKGQTTIAHDDCSCHVKAAREALEELQRKPARRIRGLARINASVIRNAERGR